MTFTPAAQRCWKCGRILFSTRAGTVPRHWRNPEASKRVWCEESDRAAFAGAAYGG